MEVNPYIVRGGEIKAILLTEVVTAAKRCLVVDVVLVLVNDAAVVADLQLEMINLILETDQAAS